MSESEFSELVNKVNVKSYSKCLRCWLAGINSENPYPDILFLLKLHYSRLNQLTVQVEISENKLKQVEISENIFSNLEI
jgi:hypothetical protein